MKKETNKTVEYFTRLFIIKWLWKDIYLISFKYRKYVLGKLF